MKTIDEIKKDLGYIQEFYRHKHMIGDPAKVVYPKNFKLTLETYDGAASQASEKLARVYAGIYQGNKTQKQLAAEWDITEKYIQILHKRLLLFLQEQIA